LDVAFDTGAAHPNGMVVGEPVEEIEDGKGAFFVVGKYDIH
jgi:hypothetical protein